ncbi:hypothetical protein HYH02_005467 [Chlamydomonas schloesseri]|uniref:Uncharacterized protein n=1 Tax=Chlamydomonas schloesseri TaxID=2026947 RepID=A0A835WKZ3_9CHLO|nr:hypothetical protein HYH02_005467 [Chlamydomonas schloesseri]|eukprot:KAG2449312.1 hypothetical protein HYH02_005467 [Chlamydomonas schloesseri]
MASAPALLLLLLPPLLRISLLASELLLAATHAKVLCCVGAPYPERYLASQRFGYFVWDLASVQASFLAAEPALLRRLLGSSQRTGSGGGGFAGHQQPSNGLAHQQECRPDGSNSSSTRLMSPAAPQPNSYGSAPAAHASADCAAHRPTGTAAATAPATNRPASTVGDSSYGAKLTPPSTPPGLCLPEPGIARAAAAIAAGAAGGSTSGGIGRGAAAGRFMAAMWRRLSLRGVAAAVAAGHAALHVFYIAAWDRPHARQVVAMSAVRSQRQRLARFPAAQVAWYCAGTGFDIGTHLLMAGALARVLLLGSQQ